MFRTAPVGRRGASARLFPAPFLANPSLAALSLIAALLLAALLLAAPAAASRVSPMSVELEPSGRASIARLQFTNTADRDFPIEVRAFRGEISEEGELELVPADEDFLIFPPQLVVAPLGEQVFRVQYVGDPDLPEARVYYISVRQLPIELAEGTPQIQVTVNFNVLVSVEPDNLSPEPQVNLVEPAEREGEQGLSVRVANAGAGMLYAGRSGWTIRGTTVGGNAYQRSYDAAEMGTRIGVGVVAPGKARRFFIALEQDAPADLDLASLSVEID